jgi:hypothetical protein
MRDLGKVEWFNSPRALTQIIRLPTARVQDNPAKPSRPKSSYIFFACELAIIQLSRQGQRQPIHLIMSDAPGSDGPAESRVDLPREQSQPPQHSLWYPSYATRATPANSYMNVLLIFVPIGIVAGALGWPDVAVFFLNSLAIIPLAPLIAFSTRELSANVGQVFGGLLNIALSNAVEMIVSHPCLSLVLYAASLSNAFDFYQGWHHCRKPRTDPHCSIEPSREYPV